MLDSQQIQSNWPKIKSQVLSKWNKLSEDEVEETHGSAGPLNKLVSSKYGEVADFDKTYEKICETCSPSASKRGSEFEQRSTSAPFAESTRPEFSPVQDPTPDHEEIKAGKQNSRPFNPTSKL